MSWYPVVWSKGGVPYVIDCDSEECAAAISMGIAESGRNAVRVLGPYEPDVPPEQIEAAQRRVWQRILADRAQEITDLRIKLRDATTAADAWAPPKLKEQHSA